MADNRIEEKAGVHFVCSALADDSKSIDAIRSIVNSWLDEFGAPGEIPDVIQTHIETAIARISKHRDEFNLNDDDIDGLTSILEDFTLQLLQR
ncbi:MAG: hypothetical protein P4L61_01865 [Candidatus Pacebacteria bacterium]|nr:hypothetical protein [Candidatus Paceibacterota bacterium]